MSFSAANAVATGLALELVDGTALTRRAALETSFRVTARRTFSLSGDELLSVSTP